jgi:hypothetical protein
MGILRVWFARGGSEEFRALESAYHAAYRAWRDGGTVSFAGDGDEYQFPASMITDLTFRRGA